MGANELRDWRAYYELEPWGERTMDWRFALLAMLLHNSWRGEGSKASTIEDWIPDHDGERKRKKDDAIMDLRTLSPSEVREVAREMSAAFAGGDSQEFRTVLYAAPQKSLAP